MQKCFRVNHLKTNTVKTETTNTIPNMVSAGAKRFSAAFGTSKGWITVIPLTIIIIDQAHEASCTNPVIIINIIMRGCPNNNSC